MIRYIRFIQEREVHPMQYDARHYNSFHKSFKALKWVIECAQINENGQYVFQGRIDSLHVERIARLMTIGYRDGEDVLVDFVSPDGTTYNRVRVEFGAYQANGKRKIYLVRTVELMDVIAA
jgi:hypothetical protein